ncbi:DUF6199 family natural product biosynthesis protein [Paenibacillus pabuli]|uniref:DUF6199 family natural product biosynthesis protein n=1 Tax=Paenibacillus pabuli TaxID=1472 RepID=UPI003D6A813F
MIRNISLQKLIPSLILRIACYTPTDARDPEPSDFYYLMTRIGGIVVMIGSVWIAFKAF